MHYYVVLTTMKTLRQSEAHRKSLGMAIRQRRRTAGLSQEKFAERVDCHRNYVGLVERGEQNVTIDMLARIAKALRCSITALVTQAGL